MIELDIKYAGSSYDGKPCFIILHNKTFNICAPGYRGGSVQTIDYSSVKHVVVSGDDLIVKILRTEVTLHGIGCEEAAGLAQLIEIGRNEPIESSKAFRKYKKMAEKEEARADRRQVRVEKFAAVVDSINRYREQSHQKELEEQKRQEEEQKRQEIHELELEHRIDALEDEIEKQAIKPSDTEEEALAKVLKLNRLFSKCMSKSDYATQVKSILRACEDNISVLQVTHPDSSVTAKAEAQLQQFILEKKKDMRQRRIAGALVLLGIIAFFVFITFIDHISYFINQIFPKE